VLAVAIDTAWWIASTIAGMNGSTWARNASGTWARIAAPRSPTAVAASNWPPPAAASSGGTPAAISWRGASAASVVPKIVPVIASPIVPPTDWKNVRLLVAVPSRSTGTLFWTISVKTANDGPTPMPVMNIQSQTSGIGVSARRFVSSHSPAAIVTSATKISAL
jgi:hypothetical protein